MQMPATYSAPPTVSRLTTPSIYSAVWRPGRSPGMLACCFFRWSATSTGWKVAAVVMWLGEQATERGIGNGTSLIIFSSIVSGIPQGIANYFAVSGGEVQPLSLLALATFLVACIALVVLFERAQRRIPIQYARRQLGRRVYGGQTAHLPLEVNMASMIPPIFASSVLTFPQMLSNALPLMGRFSSALNRGDWIFNTGLGIHSWGDHAHAVDELRPWPTSGRRQRHALPVDKLRPWPAIRCCLSHAQPIDELRPWPANDGRQRHALPVHNLLPWPANDGRRRHALPVHNLLPWPANDGRQRHALPVHNLLPWRTKDLCLDHAHAVDQLRPWATSRRRQRHALAVDKLRPHPAILRCLRHALPADELRPWPANDRCQRHALPVDELLPWPTFAERLRQRAVLDGGWFLLADARVIPGGAAGR
jgi:hypothetical protein